MSTWGMVSRSVCKSHSGGENSPPPRKRTRGVYSRSMIEPSVNDLNPIIKPGEETEPMFLIDTTGSMSYGAEEGSDFPQRREVLREAIGRIVEVLGAEDSQAEHEQDAAEDAEDTGGVKAVTFAGGTGHSIGDLSSDNLNKKWHEIRWGGHTEILPGWVKLQEVYLKEFGPRKPEDRPIELAAIFTDGVADDTDAFAQELAKVKGKVYVVLAIMGYGDEHNRALTAYQAIAKNNDQVRVVTFGNETNPDVIAKGLLSIAGVK